MDYNTLYGTVLTFFLFNAAGIIVYNAIFAYSFTRRKLFALRVVLCFLGIMVVSVALAAVFNYAFTHTFSYELKYVEIFRIVLYIMSIGIGVLSIWICFDEKISTILFASVMGNAGHCFASNIYQIIISTSGMNTMYSAIFNGFDWKVNLIFFSIHIAVLIVFYFLFAKKFEKTLKNFDKEISKSIIGVALLFTFVMGGLQQSNLFNPEFGFISNEVVAPTYYAIIALFDLFIMFVMSSILKWAYAVQEKNAEKVFYESYKEKTEMQERNMELINIKVHDMKHQIRTLMEGQNLDKEFIEETQSAINFYDNQVKTGNNTLDTLLTQKSLMCNSYNIQLTVMLDGEALYFMSSQDINSFFGNAIDNAIEYLMHVEEENRFIRISSSKQGSMFNIRIENYCTDAINFHSNGLPKSTKVQNGYHGFGTKSIQTIAKKYNGDVSFTRIDNLFIITAIFMF